LASEPDEEDEEEEEEDAVVPINEDASSLMYSNANALEVVTCTSR